MNKRLKQCPVCNSRLKIIEYHCENCDTTITGKFEIGNFALLSIAQQEFAKIFICCNGNIKEVEKQLSISYPTVKNKLAEVKNVLCPTNQISKNNSHHSNSNHLLKELEQGNLSVEEVLAQLERRK